MLILIDNGHGSDTPGKRSPDGTILEWRTTRRIAALLQQCLASDGITSRLLVPEDNDVPLRQRVARANVLCASQPALLVSLHINAAGADGRWHNAQGWQVCIAPRASAASRRLTTLLARHAAATTLPDMDGPLALRQPLPSQPYWEQNLAICRDTHCPAVLTENLFMDCHADAALLRRDDVLQALAEMHARALRDFIS